MYSLEVARIADEVFDCLFSRNYNCTYDQVYEIARAWKELLDLETQHKQMIDLYVQHRTCVYSKLSSVLFRHKESKRAEVMSMINTLLKT